MNIQFYRGLDGHWYLRFYGILIWRSAGRTEGDNFIGLNNGATQRTFK